MGKLRLAVLCFFIALGLGVSTRAADSLARVDAFSFGGVGVAGTPSAGELEFRGVLARSDALRVFQKLLESGNSEAKCYALVGIRKLAPKDFPALAAPFRDGTAKIKTISGCMIMEQPMGAVVAGIERGNYDSYLGRKLQP